MAKFFGKIKIIFFVLTFLFSIGLHSLSIHIFNNPIRVIETVEINLQNYTSNKTEIDLEFERIQGIQKASKPVSDLYVTGWISNYDVTGGFETLSEQYRTFDSISPVYYFVNPDGSLKTVISEANRKKIDDFARSKNIKIIPAIQDFDADNLGQVLNSEENIARHNAEVMAEILKYDYYGIDLDYESTKLADKDKFFTMLSTLSAEMQREDRKLIFTVLPKWGDLISYPALPQTRKVQDWKRIADLVDEFRIMTYELFGGNTIVGPIGPLDWLELNIQYAINLGIPRDKIVLGVHTYSYDWSFRPIAKVIDYKNYFHDTSLTQNLSPGVALFNVDINKIRDGYDFQESFNDAWGEGIGRYIFRGVERIVVYPTDRSFELRKQLAAAYGIKGIAYWKVGGEGGLKL